MADEPIFRLDGGRLRRKYYGRAAVPTVGGIVVALLMVWYYLFIEASAGAVIFLVLGIILSAQGVVIFMGAKRNPDFVIYEDRVVLPVPSPVAALRTKDYSVPLKEVREIAPRADDRFVFVTRRGSLMLELREFSTDADEIADMRLHINRLVDRISNGEGERNRFDGNVLREHNGVNGREKSEGRTRKKKKGAGVKKKMDADALAAISMSGKPIKAKRK